MATINVSEFAQAIDTTPREARKFLRIVTPEDAQPGKGGRWMIEKRDIRSLKSKFSKYLAERAVEATEVEEIDAPEVDAE